MRDHVAVLINKYKRKIKAEEKAIGIAPDEPTELDNMLEEISGIEKSSDLEQQENNDKKNQRNWKRTKLKL